MTTHTHADIVIGTTCVFPLMWLLGSEGTAALGLSQEVTMCVRGRECVLKNMLYKAPPLWACPRMYVCVCVYVHIQMGTDEAKRTGQEA
jgi:hypothetical protein